MNTMQLLALVQQARNINQDKDLAALLGVNKAAVSNWRHGKRQPDAVTCARIAQITGEPLARVLGIVGEARAISKEEKAVWKRLANAAAVVVMFGTFAVPMLYSAPANAGTSYTLCEVGIVGVFLLYAAAMSYRPHHSLRSELIALANG
ncbi:MAG: helix-turn-helix transcriptional regulator [Opitutus sp.]